jgi:hypothetical protein
MLVLVCGSRTLGMKDYGTIYDRLARLPGDATIMHGDARGVDRKAESLARGFNIPTRAYPADWETHGKKAGHVRNDEMLDRADLVLAFWNGFSPGTRSVIEKARERGIPFEVIPISDPLS